MKKILVLVITLLAINSVLFAKIRRVGLTGMPVAGTDYSSLQAAHDASVAGDTIYMFPGALMNCTVNRKLIIMGPGYFLNPSDPTYPGNAGLQNSVVSTTSNGGFQLLAGSEGSEVYGCNFEYWIQFNTVTGNVLFKRCRFKGTGGSGALLFYNNASQFIFQQCVIEDDLTSQNPGITVSNMSFLNCLFAFASANSFNLANSNFSGIIQNCVIANGNALNLSNSSWLIQNTISQGGGFNGANIVFANNIGTSTQFPAGNGNQQNKAWNTIFELTGSWNGKYALKAGSPAIGAGSTGIDCGIFGGASPYRLSRIPPIPTIYSLTSPQGTTPSGTSLQIDVSTRSNN